jgi:titin
VAASPGNAEATVSWTAPLANGSSITGYVVTPYIAGVAQSPQTFNTTATTDTLSGLSNGTTYTFTIAGVNAIGEGNQSLATNAVTVGAPSAPTAVTATGVNIQVTVSWTAPPDNGSPITAYVITAYCYPPGGGLPVVSSVTFNSPATTETVVGGTSGYTCTFAVAAVNGEGQGPDSAPSNAVTIQ